MAPKKWTHFLAQYDFVGRCKHSFVTSNKVTKEYFQQLYCQIKEIETMRTFIHQETIFIVVSLYKKMTPQTFKLDILKIEAKVMRCNE